ncbi:hypothetical protein DY000_02056845 [Brassica cretica]|uniref:Uncharacterized protein n=1 Tax=Brassica cretica TaxID=69181 RepID=A0ABQ7AJM5_BRACR|nr:hypothetical protein DY000_02056845 [Brassica cretica]
MENFTPDHPTSSSQQSVMACYLALSINQAPVVNMEDGQATKSATNMSDAQKISLGVGEAKSARSCSRREQTQTPPA